MKEPKKEKIIAGKKSARKSPAAKKPQVKKPAAIKPAEKKPQVKKAPAQKEPDSPEKKQLLADLAKHIENLNESGLKFLIRQSEILLYNMQVEKVNTEIQKLTLNKNKTEQKADRTKDKAGLEIVEAADSSSFIFVINRTRKFFTLDEMKMIVKICHSAADQKDAAGRLYGWMQSNRGDALFDIGIRSAADPAFAEIYNYILKKYTVKE